MVIAYSAQPNQVALDGERRNSPFAQALLKYIDQPGLEIGTLFRRVARDVNDATGGKQTPELSLSLFGDFYLNPRPTDMQAWANIRDTGNESQFKQFAQDYPQSILAHDARERLAAIARDRRDAELRAQQKAALEKAQQEHEAQLKALAEQERRERDKMIREIAEREKREREQLAKEVTEIAKARAVQEQQLRAQLEHARLEREKLAESLAEREKSRTDELSEQQRAAHNREIERSLAQEKDERERLTQQLCGFGPSRAIRRSSSCVRKPSGRRLNVIVSPRHWLSKGRRLHRRRV